MACIAPSPVQQILGIPVACLSIPPLHVMCNPCAEGVGRGGFRGCWGAMHQQLKTLTKAYSAAPKTGHGHRKQQWTYPFPFGNPPLPADPQATACAIAAHQKTEHTNKAQRHRAQLQKAIPESNMQNMTSTKWERGKGEAQGCASQVAFVHDT